MTRPAPLVRLPRPSLVTSALDAMRGQIATGAWPVGQRIPREAQLADMFQIGRNTVREAVRVLSHAGILEVRQGDGTYVRQVQDPAGIMRAISRSSLRDHFELRAALEVEAARRAAERRSEHDLRAMEKALEARGEWSGTGDIDAFLERDAAFHLAVAEAGQNGALTELYRYFLTAARQAARAALIEHNVTEPGLVPHQRLFQAIAARDGARAARAARAVLRPLIRTLS
ncbi:FadR family transcriptional regulator [Gluconacetobacter sacchari]|uniref:FadR family transcriptional regulator n=3 Tax=Gluconacetobacter sacchari TaxID=92759 RepID=A0A7W4IFP6_9PROT|nr:FadR family transcriptional regulator [Gluconacetobacter sacchari]